MDVAGFINISENAGSSKLSADVVIYNAFIMVAGILDIFLTVLLIRTLIFRRGYHTNVKIIMGNFIFGLFLVGLSNFLQSLSMFCGYQKMDNAQFLLLLGMAIVHGPNLWRISFLCFLIERSIATLKTSSYENNKSIALGVFLTVIAECATMFLGLNYFYLNFNMYYQLGIVFSIDILDIFTLIVLMKINKQKRKINIKSQIALSQRYQIVENIRVLNVLFPLIIVGITCNIIGIVATTLQALYDPVQLTKTSIYALVNVLFPMVSFMIILKVDKVSRRRIKGLCLKKGEEESLDSMSTLSQKRPEIKNAVGQNLIPHESPEKHFEHLNSMWK